ncbi:MAG TPA: hypothetical protein VMU84_03560 [Thermoanaerobaculia bacterium]|nr:hypothetical protein [Thermoanaerobaculia bacterium]
MLLIEAAGIANAIAAERYLRSNFAGRCVRVVFEPQETDLAAAIANTEQLEAMFTNDTTPRLLDGTGATSGPLLRLALQCGYDSRIGFEDTELLEDGTRATNAISYGRRCRSKAAGY